VIKDLKVMLVSKVTEDLKLLKVTEDLKDTEVTKDHKVIRDILQRHQKDQQVIEDL
jgi:hypothetical protein